jgi:truncated hemoglobin YjbI
MLLGGSRSFTGRDLNTAHAGARASGLNDADFDALLKHFEESLQELNVAPDYTREVIALLETTRNSVLGR